MKKLIISILFFSAIALFPLFSADRYYIRFLTYLFMWASLAQCWNISSGFSGYIDFGPVAYFGIGAYATTISMTMFHYPFFLALLISSFVSVLIAIFIAFPTLRIKGAYFAIATFAFAETVKQIVLSFDRTFHVSFFKGSYGITLPISTDSNIFYYYMLFVCFTIFIVTFFIENSRLGIALKAISESEEASELIGINTFFCKILVYSISAFFISLIGGIYAYWITYITPDDVFNIHKTVQMVIMTLLGGVGTLYGPLIGAVFLNVISELLGTTFIEDYLILVGIIVILVIMIQPEGIYGIKKWKKFLKLKT